MDLATNYMGLALRNPLVASPSPLTHTVEGVRRLADAGVGAVVLHSLFEEELVEAAARTARLVEAGTERFAESLSYFPATAAREPGPRRYLSLLERAAAAVDIPVIASLNGVTPGGWTTYARALQGAGAAAIELNLFHPPTDRAVSGREIEQRHLEVLQQVKAAVTSPVAVKLSPYWSSTGEMARALDAAGADALVLFSRSPLPDVDPASFRVVRGLQLSSPSEARLPRAWISLLAGQLQAALAASTGVEDALDVVKYLLAGADVVMSTSALLRHGPNHATVLLDGLSAWMRLQGLETVSALRGKTAASLDERGDYVRLLRAADASTYGVW